MQKSLFIQKQSRKPGDQKFEAQNNGKRVVNQICNQNQKSELQN